MATCIEWYNVFLFCSWFVTLYVQNLSVFYECHLYIYIGVLKLPYEADIKYLSLII